MRKQLYDALVGRKILRRARYVCFASESEAERALDVVRRDQVLVVTLGASLDRPIASDVLSQFFGETPRGLCFAYIGRLAQKKRPDVLIRAWAKSGVGRVGGKLVIAGPDEDFTKAQLVKMCDDLDVTDSVLLPGAIYGSTKSWLLRRSGSFVLVSENENFAISVAEAMLAGCFVITSKEVAASSHVRRAGAGVILDRVDADALANALKGVATNEFDIDCSGDGGRRYAESELSWNTLATALITRLRDELRG